MMTILKIIIAVFVIMCVAGLLRGKGRTKARSSETNREIERVDGYEEKIRAYEADPDGCGITEDEYIYSCYMVGKPYMGIDLKKAVSFQTTCEMRGIHSVDGMRNILNHKEIFGDMIHEGIDVNMLYDLGDRVSRITEGYRRIDKAQKEL